MVSWSARREDQACTSPRHFCVQGRLHISAARSVILSRVRLAIIWLSPRGVNALERGIGRSIFQKVPKAAQQCISVPRCLFLQARNAVEAFSSLALGLTGVFRKSS